jgi:hypothetical protein
MLYSGLHLYSHLDSVSRPGDKHRLGLPGQLLGLRHGRPAPAELQVLLGGSLLLDLLNFPSGYAPYTNATFTAVSTTTRLQFNGRGTLGTILLDDVCVDVSGGACGGAASVPEPGSAALTGLASLLVFALRRVRNAG